ncbi:MAG: polyketide cyclase [Bacteroidales bacterium]|nr:polyketide cyclase [Bacteroidales bacterium]
MKKVFYFIVGLFAFILIVAAFVDQDYMVTRSVKINQPNEVVFDYVKYLKNQDNYSVWSQIDPNMKKTFTGTDGTVGFISAWDSKHPDVGSGEQEIMNIIEGERIDFELRFLKPFEMVSPAFMITEPVSAYQTKIEWGFEGHMNYPMNLMLLFMDMEEVLGKDLQDGLNDLKIILEK